MPVALSPEILRAARGLLDWGQKRMAIEAGVSHATVKNFESRKFAATEATISKLTEALTPWVVFHADMRGVALRAGTTPPPKPSPKSEPEAKAKAETPSPVVAIPRPLAVTTAPNRVVIPRAAGRL